MIKYVLLLMGLLCSTAGLSEEADIPLMRARIDLKDPASLQRGAAHFMNYCAGCHSLKYVRYSVMAKDIGIVDGEGEVMSTAVADNLMFMGDKLSNTIQTALTPEQGVAWFGVAPPDLSLIARSRGIHWVYTYLKSFYLDDTKPWGVNNYLYPDVAMPDVLFGLKEQLLAEEGGEAAYDSVILDIVAFLAYSSEPMQLERKRIGLWVLLFLGIFFVFACLLKREYWKDIPKE